VQTVPEELNTAFRRGYNIDVLPFAYVEFNFNRFVKTTVTNAGVENKDSTWPYNIDYFPIESITSPMRPDSSIQYAFTDDESYTTSPMTTGLDSVRYYTVEKDEVFEYWVSPIMSSANYEQDFGYAIDKVQPTVIYDSPVRTNKIRVGFAMNTAPMSWTLEITTDGTNWTAITRPDVNPITGRADIWWNGTSWVKTQQLDETKWIALKGIRINVASVDKPSRQMGLMELGARREFDISYRVEDMSFEMSMDESDFIYPVGQISANSGKIAINNYDKKLSDIDETSDYFGILDRWCEVRAYCEYDLTPWGGTKYKLRLGTMFTNMWAVTNEWTFDLELFDAMKYLQDTDCPAMWAEDISITNLVSRILDMAGLSNYAFDGSDFAESNMVKWFWADGTKTFYDVLQELCRDNQAALWVDEFGIFQLMTRDQIANDNDNAIWAFLYQNSGNDVADVLTVKRKYDIQANEVDIKYKKRRRKVDDLDLTQTELTSVLYEGSDTVVLRGAPLKQIITANGTEDIWVTPDAASRWPYEGRVNIDGEVFEIKGKGYNVWKFENGKAPVKTEVKMEKDDDRRAADLKSYQDSSNANNPWDMNIAGVDGNYLNGFTGRLYVAARDKEKLGKQFHGTYPRDGWRPMESMALQKHPLTNTYFTNNTNAPVGDWRTKTNWNAVQNRWSWNDSILTCDSNIGPVPNWEFAPIYIRTFDTSEYRQHGTRLKLQSGPAEAGLILNITNVNGYDTGDGGVDPNVDWHRCFYVTVTTTERAELAGREVNNEVFVVQKNGDSFTKLANTTDGKTAGLPLTVLTDEWIDLDVTYNEDTWIDGRQVSSIEVFVKGQFVGTFYTEDRIRNTNLGGLFCRGQNKFYFENYYATTTTDKMDDVEQNVETFSGSTVMLPAGNNQVQEINLPTNRAWLGNVVFTMATTGTDATITSLQSFGYDGSSKEYGPLTLVKDTRPHWELTYLHPTAQTVRIAYSAGTEISVSYETSTRIVDYVPFIMNAPDDQMIYDIQSGSYVSNTWNTFTQQWGEGPTPSWSVAAYGGSNESQLARRKVFADDFGSYVHEIRDFDVELEMTPAAATKIYASNERVKVVSNTYNPSRGQFTLVNASRRDEIVVGNEQLSESESIDQKLIVYGYVLEEKDEATETVKDEDAIRKRGRVKADLQADWIFTEDSAKALGTWITTHWSEPMDVIDIEVYGNAKVQLGDKVTVYYETSNLRQEWLWIVKATNRSWDEGLKVTLTLNRVR